MLQSSLGGFRLWSEGGSLPSSFFCKDGRPVAEKLGTVNCPIHSFVYSSEFLGGSVLSESVRKPGVISSSSSKSSRAPRYRASKSDNPEGRPLDLDFLLLPPVLTVSRGGKDIGVPSLSLNMLSMPTSSTASMIPRLWRFSSIFLLILDDLCSVGRKLQISEKKRKSRPSQHLHSHQESLEDFPLEYGGEYRWVKYAEMHLGM